jgi:hypothetical protein
MLPVVNFRALEKTMDRSYEYKQIVAATIIPAFANKILLALSDLKRVIVRCVEAMFLVFVI